MIKTAFGLFKTSDTADTALALLLASGFSRDEVKLIKRSDFDAKASPATEILKLGGIPAEHSGRYWDAVSCGLTLIAIFAGDRADRAVEIMDAEGAVYLEEATTEPVARAVNWLPPFPMEAFTPQGGSAGVRSFVAPVRPQRARYPCGSRRASEPEGRVLGPPGIRTRQ